MAMTTPAEAPADLVAQLEEHRATLTNQCRWILGSASEADDAVQETMVRAWQAVGEFEGRGSLLSWLRRIARNVCLDMIRAGQRRARPTDLAGWATADGAGGAGGSVGLGGPADGWLQPAGTCATSPAHADPAERAVASDEVRQAFVAALLHLSPHQRAALLLCEVLRWRASEVAELLGTSVASVNSALQRARAGVGKRSRPAGPALRLDEQQRARLQRYVGAFERQDANELAALLRHHELAESGTRPSPRP